MSRWAWLLLLPLVWVPLLGIATATLPAVPWYGWLFGVVFWILFLRRRRARQGAAVLEDGTGSGLAFSTFRGSGF